jgi:hypothetical protein
MATPLQERRKEAMRGMLTVAKAQQALKAGNAVALAEALLEMMPNLAEMRGNDGLTPKKYVDYFTPQEQAQIMAELTSKITTNVQRGIKPATDGKTPVRGKDYFTTADIDFITQVVIDQIRPPTDGSTPQKGVDYFTEQELAQLRENIGKEITPALEAFFATKIQEAIAAVPHIIERRTLPQVSLFGGRGGPGGGGSRLNIYDEGTPLGQDISAMDFVGAGVTATRVGTRVVVTIAGGSGSFADNETVSFTPNDSNVSFTLANTPSPTASVRLYWSDGTYLDNGDDYTLSGATGTFVTAPSAALSGLKLKAFYRY